ncbi:MAG TPA: histidine phosphatase family protein [Candidatus Paceibacterota bacterium]|nr:histidine phosphatase family protein [Candidatus Paceibacterota bacterium]
MPSMPITFTSIRHGESESNVAKDRAERGKPLPNEEKLMQTHTSERRLTTKGREQAKAAGVWLRHWMAVEHLHESSFRYYVSPYIRTIETAGVLGVGGKNWRQDNRLMERNWGSMDLLTYDERARRFGEVLRNRKMHAWFWRPSDGETFQDVFNRRYSMFVTYRRECEKIHCIQVSHGETMLVDRYILEYWTPIKLREYMVRHDDTVHIENCRIIQYTRVGDDGRLRDKIQRVRFVNPMDPNDPQTNLDWQPIVRPLYSPEDLLAMAAMFPRFIDDDMLESA